MCVLQMSSKSVKRHSSHDTVYSYIKCISGMVMYLNLVVNPRLLCMRSEGYCSGFFVCVCVCLLQRFKRNAGCKCQSRGTNAVLKKKS